LKRVRSWLALAGIAIAGCATLSPSVEGAFVAEDAPLVPPSSTPPALVLLGDTGIGRGADTVRLARAVAREVAGAPRAPVLVLGDLFYMKGLVGTCGDKPYSDFGCDAPGRPEDQFEAVLGPYREALPGNPLIAIAGNHDYYGGREALENSCRLMPRGAPGWRYVAQGCGLDDGHPVEVLDLGALAVFLLDSEPMLRDRDWRERTLVALRRELERFHRERPQTALLVATHHPLETHGSHNGAGPVRAIYKDFHLVFSTVLLPLTWPLQRVFGQQDPYDRRYRAYRRGLYRLFREQPVLAFASGHDHSLQHVAIAHPGIRHQLVSGAGTHRSRVKRVGLDLLFTGRLARLVGLRDALPAPRHWLLFGLGGEQGAADLTGWGFATVTPVLGGLHVQFFDPGREAPVYSALLSVRDAGAPDRSAPD
jgi:hypothetical protein